MVSFMVTAKLYGNFILDDVVPSDNLSPSLSDLGYAVSGFLVGLGTSVSKRYALVWSEWNYLARLIS